MDFVGSVVQWASGDSDGWIDLGFDRWDLLFDPVHCVRIPRHNMEPSSGYSGLLAVDILAEICQMIQSSPVIGSQ